MMGRRVEAGWRPGGGRVEAGWRPGGGRMEAGTAGQEKCRRGGKLIKAEIITKTTSRRKRNI